ncbi:hypothetical protein D3C78_1532870 [compost metagenome]
MHQSFIIKRLLRGFEHTANKRVRSGYHLLIRLLKRFHNAGFKDGHGVCIEVNTNHHKRNNHQQRVGQKKLLPYVAIPKPTPLRHDEILSSCNNLLYFDESILCYILFFFNSKLCKLNGQANSFILHSFEFLLRSTASHMLLDVRQR